MARLGDLCRFINGDRGKNYPSQADISVDGEVPFINAGHLVEGEINFSEMNYISQQKFEQLNSGKIQENDILYCLRGSLGKKAIVKDIHKGAIASSLVIIRPDTTRLNSDYLFYALESPTVHEQMMQANNGSSQPNLSAKSVSDYTFNLPGINEQLVIVSKLAKVNELIALRKEQLAKLDQLVKSRFIELFGNKDFPNVLFEDVCVFLRNGANIKQTKGAGGYPITRIETLSNDVFNCDRLGYADITDLSKYENYLLESGDLLISHINSVAYLGRTVQYKGQMATPVIHGMNLLCCRVSSQFNPTYVEWFMRTPMAKDYISSITKKAVNQASMTTSDLKKMTLPKPSIELQNQFAVFVEQTDKSKLAIQQSLDKLETLKKSLMQEYFG